MNSTTKSSQAGAIITEGAQGEDSEFMGSVKFCLPPSSPFSRACPTTVTFDVGRRQTRALEPGTRNLKRVTRRNALHGKDETEVANHGSWSSSRDWHGFLKTSRTCRDKFTTAPIAGGLTPAPSSGLAAILNNRPRKRPGYRLSPMRSMPSGRVVALAL